MYLKFCQMEAVYRGICKCIRGVQFMLNRFAVILSLRIHVVFGGETYCSADVILISILIYFSSRDGACADRTAPEIPFRGRPTTNSTRACSLGDAGKRKGAFYFLLHGSTWWRNWY